jgi:hypothetical protein
MILLDDITTTSPSGLMITGQIKSGGDCLSTILRIAENTGIPYWALYTTAATPLYWNSMDIFSGSGKGNFYVLTCGSKGISTGAYAKF